MAVVSDKNQRSYAFKKVVGNRQTDPNKQWYNEFPGILSNPHASEIWTDDIPQIPPTSSTSIIQIWNTLTLTEDVTVPNHRAWLAISGSTQLHDFIQPRFGQGYFVRVFDNALNEILTVDNSIWVFDYKNGVVWFENDPTIYGHTLPIKIKVYRYIGTTLATASGSTGTAFIPVKVTEFLTSGILENTAHTIPNGETFAMGSGSYMDVFFNGQLLTHSNNVRTFDYEEVSNSSIKFNFFVPSSNMMTYIIRKRP